MSDTSFFFSLRPAFPWSVEPLGLPGLAACAVLLVLVTVWTYAGNPQASGRRITLLVALRLAALLVALVTAARPSVGVQEDPKLPSVLVIGIDVSESMTMKDAVNGQARIDAVRRTMEKSRGTLDELAAEQNVNVVIYKFSTPDFSEATSRWEPASPADGKRTDIGTYLKHTFDRWIGEPRIRAHVLVTDGQDNGTTYSAVGEATRWGRRGVPLTPVVVGDQNTGSAARDVQVTAVSADPSPAPIKNDVTVTARVNAFNFTGTRVRAKLYFDDKEVETAEFTLTKEKDNELKFVTKAPPTPGEIKVRVRVGQEVNVGGDKTEIRALPGEVSDQNNESDTYLMVTKEGARVLIVDRFRWEETLIRDALGPERVIVDGKPTERRRFDLVEVIRQTDVFPTAEQTRLLDLDAQGYDVVIIGNVSLDELRKAAPGFEAQLVERVTKKGMGLMFLGGDFGFTGFPLRTAETPKDQTLIADLLPVEPVRGPGSIVDAQKGASGFQMIPTPEGWQGHVMRVGKDPNETRELWDKLNGARAPQPRLNGYNKLKPKAGMTVYAWTSNAIQVVPPGRPEGDVLLAANTQAGSGGRVLAFAAFDTYMWMPFGQPKERQGVEIFTRFWRQAVRWLAHQEEDEGQVYARPEYRRLPAGDTQTIWVGVKLPTGGDDPKAADQLDVRVLLPGQGPGDEDKAQKQLVVRGDRKGAKVLFKPTLPGEYTVVVTAPVKDAAGKDVVGPDGKPQRYRGTARFIAYPDVSDEMLRVAANPLYLDQLAGASGGKMLSLEDLPGFLRDLKANKGDALKPKPKYLPDWRRNHSKGFLPVWLVVFVGLLGAEWGLRRMWGMR
jgi:hypothetical protein